MLSTRRCRRASGALATFVAVAAAPLAAQAPPGSEIHLARLDGRPGRLVLRDPINATQRPGYDNQPSFVPDGSAFFYTSYRDGQADIYRFDLATRRARQVTATPESEFSPTVMPGGRRFSVVRVEADSTQRLWSFALDGSDPALEFPNVAPVGYHAWLRADTAALYVLGSPPTLEVATRTGGSTAVVTRDIGRTLALVPGSADLSFVQRSGEEAWIARWDGAGSPRHLVAAPGNDFFAWTPGGTLLAARGAVILSYRPGRDAQWQVVADSGDGAAGAITRLAVSPDGQWLAFVAAEGH